LAVTLSGQCWCYVMMTRCVPTEPKWVSLIDNEISERESIWKYQGWNFYSIPLSFRRYYYNSYQLVDYNCTENGIKSVLFPCRRTIRYTNLLMEKGYRYDFWITIVISIASKSYYFEKKSEDFFTFLMEIQNIQRKTRLTRGRFHSTVRSGSNWFKKR
jgi:hypothetical protein